MKEIRGSYFLNGEELSTSEWLAIKQAEDEAKAEEKRQAHSGKTHPPNKVSGGATYGKAKKIAEVQGSVPATK